MKRGNDPHVWQVKIIAVFENDQSGATTLPTLSDSEFESFLIWLGRFASSEDNLSNKLVLLAKNRTNAKYRLLKIIDNIRLQSPINLPKLFGQYSQFEDIPAKLKKRYFLLARIFHPDRQMAGEKWTTERMELINTAYQEALQLPPDKFMLNTQPPINSTQRHVASKDNWHFSFGLVITDALYELRLISLKYIDYIRHFSKTILLSIMVLIGIYFIIIKIGIVLEKSNNKTQYIATSPPTVTTPNALNIEQNRESQNLSFTLSQSPDINNSGLNSYSLSTEYDADIDIKTVRNQSKDEILKNDWITKTAESDGAMPMSAPAKTNVIPRDQPKHQALQDPLMINDVEIKPSQLLMNGSGDLDSKVQASAGIITSNSRTDKNLQTEAIKPRRAKYQMPVSAAQANSNNSVTHVNHPAIVDSKSNVSEIAAYPTSQDAQGFKTKTIDLHRANHQVPAKAVHTDLNNTLKHAKTPAIVDSEPKASKPLAPIKNQVVINKQNKIFALDKNAWVIQSMVYLNHNDAKEFIKNNASTWFIVPIKERSIIKYLMISNTTPTLETAHQLANELNDQQPGKQTVRSVKYLQENFQATL